MRKFESNQDNLRIPYSKKQSEQASLIKIFKVELYIG
jgi:hypothetical protein